MPLALSERIRHTERSFREWRRRRSTGALSTSLGRCTLGRRRHRRYHLNSTTLDISSLNRCLDVLLIRCHASFPPLSSFRIVGVVDVRIAADSTMLRMVNLLIALSFGVHREQLLHRMGLTCPRPDLLRPLQPVHQQKFMRKIAGTSGDLLARSLLDLVIVN
jgi:hypothetical protein